MDKGKSGGELMRLIGFTAVMVGIAWVVQILGFTHDASLVGRMLWILAAASVSGAGVGLVVTAGSLSARSVLARS